MTDTDFDSEFPNAVTRKKGSLNLARMVSASATKSSFPALTGHIPRKRPVNILPFSATVYHLEETEQDDNDLPESFCLTGTAMNPKPRQISPLFLASKARSYVSSSNAEESDVNNGSGGVAKKRRRRRRKRSKSAKDVVAASEDGASEQVGGGGNARAGTQKVVKMLQDGSLLLCRVPVLSTATRVHQKKVRSRSRSRTRSRTRSSKSPVSPATRVHHQLAKSVVCFEMETPHEPVCFTIKRDSRGQRSALPSYYYHDEHLCNRCRILKKKRAYRASLRGPKFKNFGVQTDLKVEAPVEKPHSPLNPLPTKAVIVTNFSSDAAETSCSSPNCTQRLATSRNKPVLSKSVNPESTSPPLTKNLTVNPAAKSSLPTTTARNPSPSHPQIKMVIPKFPPKSSLSKEIVTKSRIPHEVTAPDELRGRVKGGVVRLQSLGHNRSLFLVGSSRGSNVELKKLVTVHDICQASA